MCEAKNRSEWLKARQRGIGGSDAAAALGLSPYKTNVALWEEKTGRSKPLDISDKAYVKFGKEAESHLRGLFTLEYPQYFVEYNEFKMYSQPEAPWLFATLDGALTDKATGERGVLEIKTTEILRGGQYQEWKGRMPQHYYIQVLHQMLATGFSFVVLYAFIKLGFEENMRSEIRPYTIKRADVVEDLEFLLSMEHDFWSCVMQDKKPNLILPDI